MSTLKEHEISKEMILEQRKDVLQDLVIHLNKVSDEELQEHTVETIIEGFWQTRYAQALSEAKPFELEA